MPDLRTFAAHPPDKSRGAIAKRRRAECAGVALGCARMEDVGEWLKDESAKRIDRTNRLFSFGGLGLFFLYDPERVAPLIRAKYERIGEAERQAVAEELSLTRDERKAREEAVFGVSGGLPAAAPDAAGTAAAAPPKQSWKDRACALQYELSLLQDRLRDREAKCAALQDSRRKLKREVQRLGKRLKGRENADDVVKRVRSRIRKILLRVHPDKGKQVSGHELSVQLTELLAECVALP